MRAIQLGGQASMLLIYGGAFFFSFPAFVSLLHMVIVNLSVYLCVMFLTPFASLFAH